MNTDHYDFDELNAAADITTLKGVPVDLKPYRSSHGIELHGPCPFGGGCKHDGWWINVDEKPMTWSCRRKDICPSWCTGGGDPMQYIAMREHLNRKQDARKIAAILAGEIGAAPSAGPVSSGPSFRKEDQQQARTPEPPPVEWQQQVIPLVDRAALDLYKGDPESQAALYYLHDRGLSDRIIQKYKLGYIPFQGKYFGYNVDEYGRKAYKKTGVWCPEGITIPTFINGQLFRVKVRMMDQRTIAKAAARDEYEPNKKHDPHSYRYSYVTGTDKGKTSLFNADAAAQMKPRTDIVFVEGELDALLINSLIFESDYGYLQAVTFGSKSVHPPYETYYRYFRTPNRIAIVYDNDDSGREGSARLQSEIMKLKTRETPPVIATIPKQYKDFGDWYEHTGKGGIIKYLWDLFPLE